MDTAICRMFDEIDGSFEHPRFVAETSMKFLSPTSYPETITVGIGVSKLGTSSVIYKVGMFGKSTGRQLSLGKFVHVYVDKNNHRPTPIPNSHKSVMLGMMMPGWPWALPNARDARTLILTNTAKSLHIEDTVHDKKNTSTGNQCLDYYAIVRVHRALVAINARSSLSQTDTLLSIYIYTVPSQSKTSLSSFLLTEWWQHKATQQWCDYANNGRPWSLACSRARCERIKHIIWQYWKKWRRRWHVLFELLVLQGYKGRTRS